MSCTIRVGPMASVDQVMRPPLGKCSLDGQQRRDETRRTPSSSTVRQTILLVILALGALVSACEPNVPLGDKPSDIKIDPADTVEAPDVVEDTQKDDGAFDSESSDPEVSSNCEDECVIGSRQCIPESEPTVLYLSCVRAGSCLALQSVPESNKCPAESTCSAGECIACGHAGEPCCADPERWYSTPEQLICYFGGSCVGGECSGGATCGDGVCESPESCTTCSDDCGACSVCGNQICEQNESCGECPGDCGQCKYVKVACGGRHTCAINELGDVVCWGDNSEGQAPPYWPSGVPGKFVELTAGGSHTCARGGVLEGCRGNNSEGQAPSSLGAWWGVSAGDDHTCGILTVGVGSGYITCDGANTWGQADSPAGTDWVEVSASLSHIGISHTCGRRADNTISCWGGASTGEANAPAGEFKQVVSGAIFSCGLKLDGTYRCWGSTLISTPAGGPFKQLAAGSNFLCGLTMDGTVVCQNEYPGSFQQVSAGRSHVCAVDTQGHVECWGDNTYGQATPP